MTLNASTYLIFVGLVSVAAMIYGQTYQMVKFLFDNYGEDKVYDQYHQEFIDFLQS